MKKHTVVAIFDDSEHAGEAVSELKNAGYTKEISVIAKDVNSEGLETHDVKRDLGAEAAKGAGTGAVVGGVVGALAGLVAATAAVSVPVLGVAAFGPIVAALTGAGVGGAAGSLIGALTDMGIPEERAKEYQKYIESGQVLVAVASKPEDAEKVQDILEKHVKMQATGSDRAVYQYDY
jgi:uncharacterized membrane protein